MSLYDKIKELALKEVNKYVYIYVWIFGERRVNISFGYYINFFKFFFKIVEIILLSLFFFIILKI